MQELSDKLRRGLQLAEKRLLEKNARNGKLLSQGTPDGKVIYVSATELLERLQEKEKEKSTVEMNSGSIIKRQLILCPMRKF